MSGTVFTGGFSSCLSEVGRGTLVRTQEKHPLCNPNKSRARISQKSFTIGRISAAAAAVAVACDITASRTAGVKEEEAGDGKKEAEVFSTTKYLDYQLSKLVNSADDPVRQIVLLTDGADTRPYRLSWPSPSVIFDVSPGHMHDETPRKMAAAGFKIPKSCLVQHVSEDFSADENDDTDWGERLLRVGYRGDRPSVWLVEMRDDLADGYLKRILPVASSLLMKDSVFIGAVPTFTSCEVESRELLRRLFASNGFLAEFKPHGEVDSQRMLESSPGQTFDMIHDRQLFLTFVARQLRLSDPQVEYARTQMMMAEEEGDEEGFIDAW